MNSRDNDTNMASLPRSQSYTFPRAQSYTSFTVNDWMQAIRTPTPYRVGNARLHIKPRMIAYMTLVTFAVLVLLIYFIPTSSTSRLNFRNCENMFLKRKTDLDLTYPLTRSVRTSDGFQYKIAIVSDLDTESKSKTKSNTWISYLKYGNLTISDDYRKISISFDEELTLQSKLSEGGRGMELSELIVFNGKLYTVDDRTGVVYEIINNKVIPWVILTDGNGREAKGFKCEWAAVKEGRMYVGGLGKEWTTKEGEVLQTNPQWVKSIGPNGDILHHDWKHNYNALRAETGMNLPGYMIHESCVWSQIHQRWIFLPRRASKEKYNEVADERLATNLMFTADDDFKKIEVSTVGELSLTHGFSSFKFIPGTNDNVIVALKSEEDGDTKASYVLAFTIDGKVLYREKKVGDKKFEGIEFV